MVALLQDLWRERKKYRAEVARMVAEREPLFEQVAETIARLANGSARREVRVTAERDVAVAALTELVDAEEAYAKAYAGSANRLDKAWERARSALGRGL